MLETYMKLCVTELDFPDFFFFFFFAQKIGKNGTKTGFFLSILKNFVINFYWICSIMKIYIICCVSAQVRYLGKFWFLRYGPKRPQPIKLQDFSINHISRTNQWNSLIFCMLIQIHINQKLSQNFWMGMVRNGYCQSGHGTLKLAVLQEWIDGMNLFFACWCNFRKAKSYFNDFWVGLVKNGCDHLVHETLKSAE